MREYQLTNQTSRSTFKRKAKKAAEPEFSKKLRLSSKKYQRIQIWRNIYAAKRALHIAGDPIRLLELKGSEMDVVFFGVDTKKSRLLKDSVAETWHIRIHPPTDESPIPTLSTRSNFGYTGKLVARNTADSRWYEKDLKSFPEYGWARKHP